MSKLERLDLSSNVVAHASKAAAAATPAVPDLSGLEELTHALARLRVEHLDFTGNLLGSRGGVMLGAATGTFAELRSLRLAFCDVGPHGAVAVASSLHSLKQLVFLDLSHCSVMDRGAMAVAEALEKAHPLESLSLFANSIGNDGGTAIMQALRSNFQLLALSIGDNQVPAVHLRVIERIISFNNQYRSLKHRNDKFEGFGHNLMAESLKTWARGDMFIAQRLLHRLQHPRDALEEEVAKLLLSEDRQSVNLDPKSTAVHLPDPHSLTELPPLGDLLSDSETQLAAQAGDVVSANGSEGDPPPA